MKRFLVAVLAVVLMVSLASCQKGQEAGGTSSIKWIPYEEAMNRAKEGDKPAMLFFTRQGCPACGQLEDGTFRDPEVASTLNRAFLPVKVDADRNPRLVQHFRIFVFPTIWFYVKGDLVGPIIGYSPPDHFKKVLRYISTGAYKTQDFRDFQG